MGYASVSTTLNIYSHILSDDHSDAMAVFGAMSTRRHRATWFRSEVAPRVTWWTIAPLACTLAVVNSLIDGTPGARIDVVHTLTEMQYRRFKDAYLVFERLVSRSPLVLFGESIRVLEEELAGSRRMSMERTLLLGVPNPCTPRDSASERRFSEFALPCFWFLTTPSGGTPKVPPIESAWRRRPRLHLTIRWPTASLPDSGMP